MTVQPIGMRPAHSSEFLSLRLNENSQENAQTDNSSGIRYSIDDDSKILRVFQMDQESGAMIKVCETLLSNRYSATEKCKAYGDNFFFVLQNQDIPDYENNKKLTLFYYNSGERKVNRLLGNLADVSFTPSLAVCLNIFSRQEVQLSYGKAMRYQYVIFDLTALKKAPDGENMIPHAIQFFKHDPRITCYPEENSDKFIIRRTVNGRRERCLIDLITMQIINGRAQQS